MDNVNELAPIYYHKPSIVFVEGRRSSLLAFICFIMIFEVAPRVIRKYWRGPQDDFNQTINEGTSGPHRPVRRKPNRGKYLPISKQFLCNRRWGLAMDERREPTFLEDVLFRVGFDINSNRTQHDYMYSRYLEQFTTPLNPGMRSEIDNALKNDVIDHARKGNAHEEAATERNTATVQMLDAVTSCGLNPYYVSKSRRENGQRGYRLYYQVPDLSQDVQLDPVQDNDALIMTDVDYHADMHYWLSFGRPILLYTFTPEKVAGRIKDGYFVIRDDKVQYHCNGGKEQRHKIWNYNDDTIVTEHNNVRMLSHVSHFKLSNHRRIISIVPYVKWDFRSSFWNRRNPFVGAYFNKLCANKLKYMKYTFAVSEHGGETQTINAIKTMVSDRPQISLALNGQYNSINIPLEIYEGHFAVNKIAHSKHLSDTVRRTQLETEKAAIIHLASFIPPESLNTVHKAGNFAPHFKAVMPSDDIINNVDGCDDKIYAHQFAAQPISVQDKYPMVSTSNTKASIEGRVYKPMREAEQFSIFTPAKVKPSNGTPENRRLKAFYVRCADEFRRLVVPDHLAGKGRPCLLQEIDDKQDKKLQRARSAKANCDVFTKTIISAFMKKESSTGDPRNISSFNTEHTLCLSSFTTQFKESILKRLHWYMPCKTPIEIADCVCDFACKNESLTATDQSRFDGHVTPWTQTNMLHAIYCRWVHPDHIQTLKSLLRAETTAPAYAGKMKYYPGSTTKSGSALTTDGNTLITAFDAYCAARMHGWSPKKAFKTIGPCYGDDTVRTGAIPDEVYIRSAKNIGLKVKIEEVARRGQPITFLSRTYIDPWSSTSSIQAPVRLLKKLHQTVSNKGKDDLHRAGIDKVSGYVVTDSCTPFVAEWMRCYLRNVPLSEHTTQFSKDTDTTWWSKDADFRANTWPQDESLREGYLDIIAKGLKVQVSEINDVIEKLNNYTGDVMNMPTLQVCIDEKISREMILDGELRGPGEVPITIDFNQSPENDNNTASTGGIQRPSQSQPDSESSSGDGKPKSQSDSGKKALRNSPKPSGTNKPRKPTKGKKGDRPSGPNRNGPDAPGTNGNSHSGKNRGGGKRNNSKRNSKPKSNGPSTNNNGTSTGSTGVPARIFI
nr:MAG: RNA-dependent RNA polymerase [Nodaviridae sp.]